MRRCFSAPTGIIAAAGLLFFARGYIKRRTTVAKVELLRNLYPKIWLMLSNADASGLRLTSLERYLNSRYLLPQNPHRRQSVDKKLGILLRFLRGHATALVVKDSLIANAGRGLFARAPFRCNDLLCVYRGTRLSLKRLLERSDRAYVMGLGLNCHIDAGPHLDVLARYINDNFQAEKLNAKFVKLREHEVALVVATRDIAQGEEIYAPYGEGYWRCREQ